MSADFHTSSFSFFHVDMRFFTPPRTTLGSLSRGEFLDFAFSEIQNLSGNSFAIVPAYDYSFTQLRHFDPELSKTSLGPFPDSAIGRSGWFREATPVFSHMIRGLDVSGTNSPFGEESLFGQLAKTRSKIHLMGVDVSRMTYLHHIEFLASIPYRYEKEFLGTIRLKGETTTTSVSFHVRPPGGLIQYDFDKINRYLTSVKAITKSGGNHLSGYATDIRDAILKQLMSNPLWVLTRDSSQSVSEKLHQLGRPFRLEDFE